MTLQNEFYKITRRSEDDGQVSFHLELLPESYIFKAHFPGNPIVPGVCQLQMIGELLRGVLGRDVYLKEIKNVKYLTVMSPKAQTAYCLAFQKIQTEADECRVLAVYKDTERQYAKLSLVFSYQQN